MRSQIKRNPPHSGAQHGTVKLYSLIFKGDTGRESTCRNHYRILQAYGRNLNTDITTV
jgi:hypothetical protein